MKAEDFFFNLKMFACFNLGEIKDIVDDNEQRFAAVGDGAGKLLLTRVEGRIQQQVGHPQHGVHGGANLMAHHGQKVALGAIGGVRLFGHNVGSGRGLFEFEVGLPKFLLGQLDERDVGVGAEHHQRLAIGGPGDDLTTVVYPDPVPVLVFHLNGALVEREFAGKMAL